jgi:hypothetical protein
VIPEKYLNQLHEMGLLTSSPVSVFANGVYVMKPVATVGNNIAGYKTGLASFGDGGEVDCVDCDATALRFIHCDGIWQVNGMDSCGGIAPADFINEWSTAEEAVQDIRDFFFGDPTRMNAKAAYFRDPKGETEKAIRENRMPVFGK